MTLFNQIIIAIVTYVMIGLANYFYDVKAKEFDKDVSERNEEKLKKYNLLNNIFVGLSFLVTGYFLYYLITTIPQYTVWNIVVVFIKTLVFSIVWNVMLHEEEDETSETASLFIFTTVIAFVIVAMGLWINYVVQENSYEKNITVIEEIKYSKQEYKLLNEFDSNDLEESNVVENSVSEYFDYETTTYKGRISTRIYKICYLTENEGKSEMIFKKIDGENTKLVPLKKDEEPYLEVKTYIQNGIDNRQEPPKNIIISEEVEYILHVPQEDINKVLELEK